MSLVLRSVFWTIVFPGVIAGYVPWRFFGVDRVRFNSLDVPQIAGLVCAGIGVALLVACIVEFARSGRGTLSPADPPRELVVRGLYRYVRNPMYLSVTLMVLGQALLVQSRDLAIYWAAFFVAANLFVLLYEEPYLRRRFGASYDDYTRNVGRWIPRVPRVERRGPW